MASLVVPTSHCLHSALHTQRLSPEVVVGNDSRDIMFHSWSQEHDKITKALLYEIEIRSDRIRRRKSK